MKNWKSPYLGDSKILDLVPHYWLNFHTNMLRGNEDLLFEAEILAKVTCSRRAHKSRPASSCAPPPRPSWPRPPPWWPPPTTSSLPAGLFVTKVLPIPHNQQALITRAELGKGTYVEALPFVFRGASSRWGERGATALLSGTRRPLQRRFCACGGGASGAQLLWQQVPLFPNSVTSLNFQPWRWRWPLHSSLLGIWWQICVGAPSCVINCSVTHYILLQKDGFNFFVN